VTENITLDEVGRRLNEISVRLDQLINRTEFDVHQRLIDQRIDVLTRDIAEIKARLSLAESRRWQGGLAVVTAFVFPLILVVLAEWARR
jgi:hypothetical protein